MDDHVKVSASWKPWMVWNEVEVPNPEIQWRDNPTYLCGPEMPPAHDDPDPWKSLNKIVGITFKSDGSFILCIKTEWHNSFDWWFGHVVPDKGTISIFTPAYHSV